MGFRESSQKYISIYKAYSLSYTFYIGVSLTNLPKNYNTGWKSISMNLARILVPLTLLNMLNKLFFAVWSYENENISCLNFVEPFIVCMSHDNTLVKIKVEYKKRHLTWTTQQKWHLAQITYYKVPLSWVLSCWVLGCVYCSAKGCYTKRDGFIIIGIFYRVFLRK